ncbi:DUF4192 domain-containing protein [Amycolatopsis sp. NPDC059090]|uniref:DUF4192 domain-containing protein n=1 Tax=unclassified Amycolatopsis TaxID=2618356 RepID=UPI0036714FD6
MSDPKPPNLDAAGQFLANIPAIVGFYPAEAVILLHLRPGDDGLDRVGVTMRLGLASLAADPAESGRTVTGPLRAQPTGTVIAVVVSHLGDADAELPLRAEIDILASAITEAGHRVRAVFFVPEFREGSWWRSYYDRSGTSGIMPDPTTSLIAIASADSGVTIQPSRQAIEDLFRRASTDEQERIARATRIAAARQQEAPEPLAKRIEAFDAAVASAVDGELPSADEDIANLIASFSSPLFRDACVLPADGRHPERQRVQLLLHLHRLAPSAERREISGVLAVGYYLLGEYLYAEIATQQVTIPTLHAVLVARNVQRAINPFAHRGSFAEYFRSARSAVERTRTVGSESERDPRLLTLVDEAKRQIRAELDRNDLRALNARVNRVDSAVNAWSVGRHPQSDEELAGLVAAVASPRVGLAVLLPSAGHDTDSSRVSFFRCLFEVSPLDYASDIAAALAFAECTQGNFEAARAAILAIDPPSPFAEKMRARTLDPSGGDLTVIIASLARAERRSLLDGSE